METFLTVLAQSWKRRSVQILQIVENGQCNLNMFVGWIAMQELE
jgi:hypothetical protein